MKQGTDRPGPEPGHAHKLSHRAFQEEQGHASNDDQYKVRNEESTCRKRRTFKIVFANWLYSCLKSIHQIGYYVYKYDPVCLQFMSITKKQVI